MSALSAQCRHALTRARWALIQTGLITTGLALFGVYVLANRINDEHVMSLYVLRYVPLGPWLVGTIAGIGYGLAAWWLGLPVRGWLLAAVLALQTCAYFLGHYVDLQSREYVYRDTGEPVGFVDYYHVSTGYFGGAIADSGERMNFPVGYTMRGIEWLVFVLPAAAATLMLVGSSRCAVCRGAVRRQQLGVIPASAIPATLHRLEHFAHRENRESFRRLLNSPSPSPAPLDDCVPLLLCRCKACGHATIEIANQAPSPRTKSPPLHVLPISAPFADSLLNSATPPVSDLATSPAHRS